MSKSPLRPDRRASRGDLAILKEAAVGLCRSCRKPHPVDHRLTLDPYGLAYSLLRSRAFTPKVVPGARLDNRMRLASAVPPFARIAFCKSRGVAVQKNGPAEAGPEFLRRKKEWGIPSVFEGSAPRY